MLTVLLLVAFEFDLLLLLLYQHGMPLLICIICAEECLPAPMLLEHARPLRRVAVERGEGVAVFIAHFRILVHCLHRRRVKESLNQKLRCIQLPWASRLGILFNPHTEELG